jgi:hypothetical protein
MIIHLQGSRFFLLQTWKKKNTNLEQSIIYKNSQDIHYVQINFVTIFLGENFRQKKTRDMGRLFHCLETQQFSLCAFPQIPCFELL